MFYLSIKLSHIQKLKDIGSNTLALFGLEFFTRGLVIPALFSLFNLNIYGNVNSSVQAIILIIFEFILNLAIIKYIINPICPILNGKYRDTKK